MNVVVRRRASTRAGSPIYVSNISEEGVLIQGNNLWVPTERTAGDSLAVREPGARDGRRSGRLELRRPVRRPEQRRHCSTCILTNGYVSAATQRRATGTTTRRSPAATARSSPTRRTGRRWAAGASPGYQQKRSGSTTAPASSSTSPRRSASPTRYDGRVGGAGGPAGTAACSTSSSPTSAGRCCSTRTTVAPEHAMDRLRAQGGCAAIRRGAANRSAIGAQVRLFWNGQQQVQEVSGGCGFCAAEPAPAALRPGQDADGREGRDPLAVGQDQTIDGPGAGPASIASRSPYDDAITTSPTRPRRSPKRTPPAVSPLDNRYLAPAPHHRHPARRPAHASASSRASRGRPSRSRPRIADGAACSAGCSSASGRTWPAPTSPGSASASWSARRPSGRTRSVRPDLDHVEVRDPRATGGTSGTRRTSASSPCCSWPPTRSPA